MKIAFFAQVLVKGEKAGIAWNAYNMIQELLKYTENTYQLDFFGMDSDTEKEQEVSKMLNNRAIMNPCRFFHGKIYNMLSCILPIPYKCFFGRDAEITHFFNFYIPPGVQGKKIAVVHDMAYKTCPETVKRKTRILLELTLKNTCKRADIILTVSEFSKSEILKYIDVEEKKIKVIPNGVDLKLFHNKYSEQCIEEVKEKYHIWNDYFLYLGTLEPRKNIERIIEAYNSLKDKEKNLPVLVLAGGKGWMYDSIFSKVENLGIQDKIIFTGYVEEEEIPKLMCGAKALVFPSLYEGFGMPPIEAMACGTPVIVSEHGALEEVVGDAGIKVNPYSVQEIESAMRELLSNNELHQELSLRGLEKAKQYTWEKAAEQLNQLYQSLK